MQRPGSNEAGYSGETIDSRRVLQEIQEIAKARGWSSECFLKSERLELTALFRVSGPEAKRVYISTGIHGDEPAGLLAVRQLLTEDKWSAGIGVWLCPCLNPTGFQLNRRENSDGVDLNRQYRNPEAEEIRAHIAWLANQPTFHLALCLHEDWEARGFYLYELNPDQQPSFGEAIIQRVAAVCPIDPSEIIEGRPAHNGIIRPELDPAKRPQWPEAFYLIMNKTRHSYTLESPSALSLRLRTDALVAGVEEASEWIALDSQGRCP